MKFFLSLLLLAITTCYILPVKEIIGKDTITAISDMDDETPGNEKNEKSKELFAFSMPDFFVAFTASVPHNHITPSIPLTLLTVVSPPPDYKG